MTKKWTNWKSKWAKWRQLLKQHDYFIDKINYVTEMFSPEQKEVVPHSGKILRLFKKYRGRNYILGDIMPGCAESQVIAVIDQSGTENKRITAMAISEIVIHDVHITHPMGNCHH